MGCKRRCERKCRQGLTIDRYWNLRRSSQGVIVAAFNAECLRGVERVHLKNQSTHQLISRIIRTTPRRRAVVDRVGKQLRPKRLPPLQNVPTTYWPTKLRGYIKQILSIAAGKVDHIRRGCTATRQGCRRESRQSRCVQVPIEGQINRTI